MKDLRRVEMKIDEAYDIIYAHIGILEEDVLDIKWRAPYTPCPEKITTKDRIVELDSDDINEIFYKHIGLKLENNHHMERHWLASSDELVITWVPFPDPPKRSQLEKLKKNFTVSAASIVVSASLLVTQIILW